MERHRNKKFGVPKAPFTQRLNISKFELVLQFEANQQHRLVAQLSHCIVFPCKWPVFKMLPYNLSNILCFFLIKNGKTHLFSL